MDATHSEVQPSEAPMEADPLANLFPRTDNIFTDLIWPPYDESVFDDDIKQREDGHILSFLAGCTYTIRCFTFDIPAPLKAPENRMDTKTRNFLAYWGCEVFTADRREYGQLIEGDQALLASFHTGVMFALKSLREMEVPEDVQKDRITWLMEAFEAQAHRQFASLIEYVAPIAQQQKLENMLKGLAGQEDNDDTDTLHDEGSENVGDNLSRDGNSNDNGDHSEAQNDDVGDVTNNQNENGDTFTSDHDDDGEFAIVFVETDEEDDREEKNNGEDEEQGQDPDRKDSEPKRSRKRAKSKKAKQAKKQQKKQQKKVKELSGAEKK